MGDARDDARRWVRRKRIFYMMLLGYVGLSVLWFLIDVLTDRDDWWFYWPMLGAGIGVTITGFIMFGMGGLFDAEWERREVDKYLDRHERRPEER
jgi:hypothetical protein